MKLRVKFYGFWRIILILLVVGLTHESKDVEENREFGLDIVSNSLGIIAGILSLVGQGTKFGGRAILMIVIPIAFAAGILVSVIVVAGFLLIFNTIVINFMFLMNLGMILGKLLYGRSGSQIINYPNIPTQPQSYIHEHLHPNLHEKLLSPLALKVLKGKKLFLLAKFFKFVIAKHPDFLEKLENFKLSEDHVRRNSENFSVEDLISSFNETEFIDRHHQLGYRGHNFRYAI